MNDLEKQERLFDLLTGKTVYGLDEKEQKKLEDLLKTFPEWQEDETFDLTVAAINLSAISADEEMPVHLRTQILADSEKYFTVRETARKVLPFESKHQKTGAEALPAAGFLEGIFKANWFGWAVAAAACIALALNLWLARPQTTEIVKNPPPTVTPNVPPTPTLAQLREQLVAADKNIVTASWADFDPKKPRGVEGDVVWSNSQQKGFVRFRGLPVNDKSKETYQLWIFDDPKNQKNPVSGGVFDANEAGEIVIPIDAALKIQKPAMFAVTAEKPGGVVVSELGKVMAVAKV